MMTSSPSSIVENQIHFVLDVPDACLDACEEVGQMLLANTNILNVESLDPNLSGWLEW